MSIAADLKPFDLKEVKVGQMFDFPIYDRDGKLLLAISHPIESEKQLKTILSNGMYKKPEWAENIVYSRRSSGTVAPSGSTKLTQKLSIEEDPSESGHTLKMSVPDDEEFFMVRLVGTLGHEAFVITHPARDGSLVFAKEGQEWDFRSFYGRSIFRFKAVIEKVLLKPYPMVILGWPISAEKEKRIIRQSRRASCELPATCKIDTGKPGAPPKLLNGVIVNLSTGGAAFCTNGLVKSREQADIALAFRLTLDGRKYVLEIKGRLMHVEYNDADDVSTLGLAFNELTDFEYVSIHGYVIDRLIQRIESPLYTAFNPD